MTVQLRPAMAQSAAPSTELQQQTANDAELIAQRDKAVVEFDGNVVECDARSDCQKAQQVVADVELALAAAKEHRENLDKAQQAASNELTDLFARTPPPSAAEIAAATTKTVSAAKETQDATTVVGVVERALESAMVAQKAACAKRGAQELPNPEVPDRNPTIPTITSPDFQSDTEFGQFAAQGSRANSS